MSVYFKSGKGWRYDFTLNRRRYTGAWFKSKRKAKEAEAEKRKEVIREQSQPETPTDMGFLELVNRRLDYVKAYHSPKHYDDYRYMAKKWVENWEKLKVSQLTADMIQAFVLERAKISHYTANKELRSLRATFNFGKKRKWIPGDPTEGIQFLPEATRIKYVPPPQDIDRVIAMTDRDTQDYLWTIRETLGRVGEVNQLTWEDVDFEKRLVTLYTRKRKGGHLTPRKVPMTQKLYDLLSGRYTQRDPDKPWVFWHSYRSKNGEKREGPYGRRKRVMKSLCKKAGVRTFQFHALRHSGASVMDNANVPAGAIQRILGHSQRRTTEIYLHSLGDIERQAMLIFERASRNSHTESHTGVRLD